MEKECDKCSIIKTNNLFRKYSNDTFSSSCKSCLNEMDKILKNRKRQIRNETVLVKCEKCNIEKALKEFAKLKKFYKKKICRSCYPDFLREQNNESKTNINYRLKKSLAARLRTVLVKENTTMNYIGCNIQYLREWFEYNFTKEMNWDNYGTYWSIDHIIPVNKFDLMIEQEKLECWNWTNLMPVTITFNCSKFEKGGCVSRRGAEPPTIDIDQMDKIKKTILKFKEEGSTTKWFSSELCLLTKDISRFKI
jgi:hypothetical protein